MEKAKIKKIIKRIILVFFLTILIYAGRCDDEPLLENPYENYNYYYKGQIHCHSNESPDGHQSPYNVELDYRSKGYNFICLTDHSFRIGWCFKHWRFNCLHEFTSDPKVPGIIHITSCERGSDMKKHRLELGKKQINPMLYVIAHPAENALDLIKQENEFYYTGVEFYNAGCGFMDSKWDEILNDCEVLNWGSERRIWGFAVDDCHDVKNNHNFNRGWIVVNSDIGPAENYLDIPQSENYLGQDILQNIKDGNFYSVVRLSPGEGTSDLGPILRIVVCGKFVLVQTDKKCKSIMFLGESGQILKLCQNEAIASYEINGSENYVRIQVIQDRPDGEEYMAFSQPLYLIQQGLNKSGPKINKSNLKIAGMNVQWDDYDNDGSLELSLSTADGTYIVNKFPGNNDNWVNVRCVSKTLDNSVVDKEVKVKAKLNDSFLWELSEKLRQKNISEQDSTSFNFDFNHKLLIDSLEIEWPSGKIDNFTDVALSEFFKILNDSKPAATLEDNSVKPENFELDQNYPNPFNSTTMIRYNLPKAAKVSLKIYNNIGQEIITLVNEFQDPGFKSITWDGKDRFGQTVNSGVYIYSLQAGNETNHKRMVYLK